MGNLSGQSYEELKINYTRIYESDKNSAAADRSIVQKLGGLHVIGTERHDSRRIDNQLRGRSARQGDPGTSKFFLSLEDKLLRLFGGTSIQNFMKNELFDDAPLESELLTKSLDAAQKRLEEMEYESRKNLFDYDEILNKQRNIIYYERRKILESSSLKMELLAYGEQIIIEIIKKIKKKNLQSINIVSRLEHF